MAMKIYIPIKSLFLFVIFSFITLIANAQNYNIDDVDGTTVNVPTASTVYFYDSGGDGGDYGDNEDYTVTFSSDNDQPLLITFTEFDLANNGWNEAVLYVYDGPDISSPVTAYTSNPGTIIPSGSSVTFRFTSDVWNRVGSGWAATISSMDLSVADVTTCSGTFTDLQGGTDYDANQYYKVTYNSAEAGKSVRMDFTDFNLGDGDRLIVIEGGDVNGLQIGTYTGNGSPGTIISSGEALTFIFASNDDVSQGRGWEANISCIMLTTYYSYQNGTWDEPLTWTLDASGTNYDNPSNAIPGPQDKAVILNGDAVTVDNNGNQVVQLDIQEGAVLDVGGTTGQDFGTIMGKGRLRSTTGALPVGVYTLFTQSGAGTIELYDNITSAPQLSESVFNNLDINANSNQTVVIDQNTRINGDLLIRGGDLEINGTGITIEVEENINLHSGTSFSVTSGNHNLYVRGDFENEGTVTFTSKTAPDYTNDPTSSVDLYFDNSMQDQLFACNGPTTLERLIVDKGTDDIYMLEVNASATDNFRLFGRNDAAATNTDDPGNVINNKALEIYAGTLKLGSNILVSRLLTSTVNLYYTIDQDATLILDGANVNVTEQNNTSSIIIYGKLKVTGNSTFTSNGTQGIILRAYGIFEITGTTVAPTVNTTVFRTSSRLELGTHRGTFIMNGGILNISGNNYATSHPAFALPFPDNTLQINAGTININHPTYYNSTNTNTYESWLVSSNNENISVTGGTINIYANGTNARINSTAPFYNLNLSSNSDNTIFIESVIEKTDGGNVVVPAAPLRKLDVINDLTVSNNTTFDPQDQAVTIGGDFILNGTYTPGNNSTIFNAYGIQAFTNAGTISDGGLYNMVLKNASILTVSNNLTIRNSLTINAETTLRDGGNAINVEGDITNSGEHQSATGGSIVLTGTAPQNISGNGLGVFDNLSLNKASGSTAMNADMQVMGELRLGGTAAVLDIGNNKLQLGADAHIYNALTGTNSGYADFDNTRMIQTDGAQSDMGVEKVWDATGSFTYPVGANGKYTPAVLQVITAPDSWGAVSVNGVDNIHPLITSTNSLNYYWNVRSEEMTGFSSGDSELRLYFDDADVAGDENLYVPAFYFPINWIFFDNVNLVTNATNEIRFNEIVDLKGHFTAGQPGSFGEVTAYYSNVANGSWDNLASWSYDAAGTQPVSELPGENSPVIIQSGDTINIPTNDKLVGSLTIEEDAVLDIDTTTGHFFGLVHESTVSGTGTLRITAYTPNAVFPGGDFGEFLGENGGTVEYYSTGTDYTLPSGNLTTINLLEEGFEGGFPAPGWTLNSSASDEGGSQWERSLVESHTDNASVQHVPSTYFWGLWYHNHDDYLITPALNFTENAIYELKFWRRNNNANDYDYQGVLVSTTGNDPGSFVEVQELGPGVEDTWVEHIIDLSDYAGEENIYIAFVYRGGEVDDVYIDDITVTKSFGEFDYHHLVINPDAGENITLPDINVNTSGNFIVQGDGVVQSATGFPATLTVQDTSFITENGTLNINNSKLFRLEQKGPLSIGTNGSLSVNNAGAESVAHRLNFYGDIENEGTLELNPGNDKYADIYFKGTTNQVFSGTGTNSLNRVYVDKGSSQVPLVDVTADDFVLNTSLEQALFINNGTIRFSGASLDLTLTTNQSFNIPQTGCLSVNGSIVTLGTAADNSADLYLSGKLEVMAGTMSIGATANNVHNDIEYATAGTPEVAVSGGVLNVNGQIRRSTTIATGNLTYRQSGGDVYIYGKNRDANQIQRGLLEVLNNGQFISSGGTLNLIGGVTDSETNNTFGELYLNPDSYTVTGGTIVTGSSQTSGTENVFNLYLGSPIYSLTVDGDTNAKEARLRTFTANIKGDLTINGTAASAFNTSGLAVNIGGNMANNSSAAEAYIAGSDTQTTTFNGMITNQTIDNNSSERLSFGNLIIDNNQSSGTVAFTGTRELEVLGDLTVQAGTFVADNQYLNLYGDFYNHNIYSSTSSSGFIQFEDAANQYIYGTNNAEFGNIHIRSGKAVIAEIDFRLNGELYLHAATSYLNIGDSRLTISETGTVTNAADGRFIVTNGALSDGGVTKEYSSAGGSFIFPVGVGTSGGKYTPATINVTNTGGVAGTINIKPYDGPHPVCTNELVDELQYYWSVNSTGFSNPTVNHIYQYVDADTTGIEGNYVNAKYDNGLKEWTKQTEEIDYTNNEILFTDVSYIDGDYTAGYVDNFGEVDVYYSSGNGNWGQASSWVLNSPTGPAASVGPKGNPVIIQNGHTITTNQNGAYAGSADIEAGGRLDLGSTVEHNLGLVSGGGTINLTSTGAGSFVFPAGDFSAFMSTTGSTVEYTGNGTLPSNIETYQNVTFLGNSTKNIPAIDILVLGDLTIADGELDNSSFNRSIRLEGDWINQSAGGFIPGTGTVIFEGGNEQFLTSSGGSGENFYNLQINKSAGTLTLNNAVNVNRVLTLTSGIVNTTATELLTVDYSQSSAVQGGSDASYINGPLRRNVNSSSNAIFPVGKDGRYGEMEIFGTNTADTQYWTAEYFNTAPMDQTNMATPLQLISNNEYWSLQGISGAEANVRLRWDDQSAIIPAGATERQKLRVAQYLPPWTIVGETVNDVSQTEGTVETVTPIIFDGSAQGFTLGLEQTASAEITSGNLSACDDGTTFPVTFNVTGDAPLEVVLQINGANNQVYDNLPEGEHTVEFTYADLYAIAGTGDYLITISSVTDYNDFSGIILGSGVTFTLLETPAPVINGPSSVLTGSTTTYSVSETSGNIYDWSVSPLGSIDDPSSSTINVTWGSTTGTATLTLTESNPNCNTTVTYDVDVRDWPVITGNFDVCAGSTETYSTRQVAGHTYNWTVTGGTITAGSGTDEITVLWSSQTAGIIELKQGPTGSLVYTSEGVVINPLPTAILTVDSALDSICIGDNTEITINFTAGIAPFDFTVRRTDEVSATDDEAFTGISADPYTYIPASAPVWIDDGTPETEYTYTIITITDSNGCTNTNQGNANVVVFKIPETGPQYHISNEFGN